MNGLNKQSPEDKVELTLDLKNIDQMIEEFPYAYDAKDRDLSTEQATTVRWIRVLMQHLVSRHVTPNFDMEL